MTSRSTTQRRSAEPTTASSSRRHGDAGDEAIQMAVPGVGVTSIEALQMAGGNQAMVQLAGDAGGESDAVHAAAARGVEGSGGSLPHAERIQASFGRHDVSNVQAHVGGAAQEATAAMGATAYATGNQVAFGGAPDLHTAAHEAAHVVQQRAGVQLKGGVGQVGDRYEQHADTVADAVVAGRSAEALLDPYAPSGGEKSTVQRKAGVAIQMAKPDKATAVNLQSGCVKKKGSKLADGDRAGGFTFGNKEGLLPATDASGASITYTEYDVNPKQAGADRDAERIVVGSDGKIWYTDDHYASFSEVK